MTISDAIPVQFWVNGVESYNQKEVCGITPACFCQPFNCDDEIRIQFESSTTESYSLSIVDSGDVEITRLDFSQTAVGIFELSLVLSELNICDENVRFIIYESLLGISGTAEQAGYTNTAIFADNWNLTSDPPSVSTVSGAPGTVTSERLYKSLGDLEEGDVINLDSTVSGGGVNLTQIVVIVGFLDYGGTLISSDIIYSQASGSSSESNSYTVPDRTVSAGAAFFFVQAFFTFSSAGNGLVSLTTFNERHEAATSDCIDVKTDHDCSVLIRYVNSKDFAGIEYTDFSPNSEFYIRVPAIFFHETNTSEEEDFETSGETIVSLRQEIKVKRRLELGYMPDYMHRKLLLILAHQTLEIDGDTWVRRDPYEKVPPANKRYPLKMANVLLTLQGYIKRNIL